MGFQPSSSISNTSVRSHENVSRGEKSAAQAGMNAGFELAADPVDADAEGVHRDPRLAGELLAVADVVLPLIAIPMVIPEHQVALVRRQLGEAPAEAFEPGVGGLVLLGGGGRPVASREGAMLPRGFPQDLLVDQMGDAAEIAVGVGRPQLDPLLQAAGDAVERDVGQILWRGATAPFEEADQLVADGLVELAGPFAVGRELAEEGFEGLGRHPEALRPGSALATLAHFHSP